MVRAHRSPWWSGQSALPAPLTLVALMLGVALASAQIAMPDPRQMAGIPRPVTDLPDRAISVRLIRGQLSNNIIGHPVELHIAGGRILTVKTDDSGRAQFNDVPGGQQVHAVATVDGERLESQAFNPPTRGGVRLLLVATDKSGPVVGGASEPARSGELVLGDSTRILVEPDDDGLRVYYMLDIVNASGAPINADRPFVLDVPAGAQGLTMLDESSPQAKVSGDRLTVTGPFVPGSTTVHTAYQLPITSGSAAIQQTMPVRAGGFVLIARKLPGLDIVSAQTTERREIQTPEGETYIVSRGQPMAAGESVSFEVTGLPHHSRTPVTVALVLAGLVVALGVWFASVRPQGAEDARPGQLRSRREQLLDRLVELEQQRRGGRIDAARFEARRLELFVALERVYGELDSGRPGHGHEGLAR